MKNITNCKDCAAPVSKNAFNCPSCGRKLKRTITETLAYTLLFIMLFAGLSIILALATK